MHSMSSSEDIIASNPAAMERAKRIAASKKARPKRHGVDPTTSDRQYTPAELEFMNAMQAHKERTGRWFPTWGEVLEVLMELGYAKDSATSAA